MTEKRWFIDGHFVEDKVTGKFHQTRDQFIVDAFNILYNEIQELKNSKDDDVVKLPNYLTEENKQLKQVLSDLAEDHEVTVEDLILWSEELRK